MRFVFENANQARDEIVNNNVIDLSNVDSMDAWTIVLVFLLMIEKQHQGDRKLILPTDTNLLLFLRQTNFFELLEKLGYKFDDNFADEKETEESSNQMIIHSNFRDAFDAYLGKFIAIFKSFGLGDNDAELATALVGELGNNTFDHNLGNWPTDVSGCFVSMINFPKENRIQVVVGDPGVGFLGSLKSAFPEIKTDNDAIKAGLKGNTGRVGEKRGNGLLSVLNWTLKEFRGNVSIHSGKGFVIVDKDGVKDENVKSILGTIVQVIIKY